MSRYYVAANGRRQGPYSTAQLRELAHRGSLGPSDMVLPEGRTRWVEAGSVRGLFGHEGNGPTNDPTECETTVSPRLTALTHGDRVGNEVWYYSKNGQSFGPFTFPHLVQLASAGLLLPADMVLNGAGRERAWLPAHTVADLFPDLPTTTNAAKRATEASSMQVTGDAKPASMTGSGWKWHPFLGLLVLGVILTGLKTVGCIREDIRTPFDRNPRERIAREIASVSAIKGSADDLDREFRANEVVANERYLGKVLEITGTITSIRAGGSGPLGGRPQVFLGAVRCEFANSTPVQELRAGQAVTIRGKCKGPRLLEYCSVRR